ncbi:Group 2 truncated hemoglobin GlbO [Geodia barretti]|uniref:Group 2 truncated hemoglobin GlbO n=1 Tax=Geodia barretti TaxID=519541 RepID=A0AA35T6N5_GEOBA|nr:Group 2 truncated hemoglobin GlbO [Geodia barretti]
MVGGQRFFDELVDRFYDAVEDDSLLRPMYPRDMGPSRRRLSGFLAQYWGGPPPARGSGAITACGCATCPSPSARPSATPGWHTWLLARRSRCRTAPPPDAQRDTGRQG